MQKKPNHNLEIGHIKNCQVCGSANLIPVLNLGHHAPCDSLLWLQHLNEMERMYPLRFMRCPDCSLAQIDYIIDPKEIFFENYPYRSGITKSLVENLRRTSQQALKRFDIPSGALAVDLGSNDGSLLSGFKDLGMRVLGVEPTRIAEIANKAGIPTVQDFFTQDIAKRIRLAHGPAGVVTAANMFAHVAKLESLIHGVEELLDDDGVFVTESHYLLDIIETLQFDSIYHEHLKFYSLKSLIRLFGYYNFTIVDVERIPNYGGSIRVYASKNRKEQIRGSVKNLLDLEEKAGLYMQSTFDKFTKRVQAAKLAIRNFAVHIAERGEKMVGVGCPGRCATLLNYCGIDQELMPYIAEQATSLKLGLFLPGNHIPIVDEERLFREQPEYAMILPWHYWKPIAAKLQQKGLRSKLVVPLPDVRTV